MNDETNYSTHAKNFLRIVTQLGKVAHSLDEVGQIPGRVAKKRYKELESQKQELLMELWWVSRAIIENRNNQRLYKED